MTAQLEPGEGKRAENRRCPQRRRRGWRSREGGEGWWPGAQGLCRAEGQPACPTALGTPGRVKVTQPWQCAHSWGRAHSWGWHINRKVHRHSWDAHTAGDAHRHRRAPTLMHAPTRAPTGPGSRTPGCPQMPPEPGPARQPLPVPHHVTAWQRPCQFPWQCLPSQEMRFALPRGGEGPTAAGGGPAVPAAPGCIPRALPT